MLEKMPSTNSLQTSYTYIYVHIRQEHWYNLFIILITDQIRLSHYTPLHLSKAYYTHPLFLSQILRRNLTSCFSTQTEGLPNIS